jgi:hypothetical protein
MLANCCHGQNADIATFCSSSDREAAEAAVWHFKVWKIFACGLTELSYYLASRA